jgi:hypothetical protein
LNALEIVKPAVTVGVGVTEYVGVMEGVTEIVGVTEGVMLIVGVTVGVTEGKSFITFTEAPRMY